MSDKSDVKSKTAAMMVALAGLKLQTAGPMVADMGDLLRAANHPDADALRAELKVAFDVLIGMNAKLLSLMNALDPVTMGKVNAEHATQSAGVE
jgi:hypothetical protein